MPDGNVLLYEVSSATLRGRVRHDRQHHRQAPRQGPQTPAGHWIEGYFYDDTKVKDKRQLNVHDLDQVSTEHPVCVQSSRRPHFVLQQQGAGAGWVTKNTPNPPGGTFDRDANGDLNGRVTDRARDVSTASASGRRSRQRRAAATRSQRHRAHLEAVRPLWPDERASRRRRSFAIQEVRARGELLHRVSFEASGQVLDAMIASGISTGFGDEWIRFGATAEHTADGSFSERTMALSQPYPAPAALQRQRHRDAGGSQRVGGAGASCGYSAQLSRQWRRRHRYGLTAYERANQARRVPTCAPRSLTAR